MMMRRVKNATKTMAVMMLGITGTVNAQAKTYTMLKLKID